MIEFQSVRAEKISINPRLVTVIRENRENQEGGTIICFDGEEYVEVLPSFESVNNKVNSENRFTEKLILGMVEQICKNMFPGGF